MRRFFFGLVYVNVFSNVMNLFQITIMMFLINHETKLDFFAVNKYRYVYVSLI